MSDDDWLSLKDPEEAAANLPAGLVVPPTCGSEELRTLDRMRLDPDPAFRNHWRVLFVDEDDNFEKDEARLAKRSAEVWRERMGWPVGTSPTPADAGQWLAHRRAVLFAKWAPLLAHARQQDEAAARGEVSSG
jgi:hypothetical protein